MTPNRILILRHAEEPTAPADPDISAAGRWRAERLSIYLPKMYGQADFLVAAAPNKLSARCFLTLRPLALATGAQIDTSFKANRDLPLATKLFEEPIYSDKFVVICWTHTYLPALAGALRARDGQYPDPWDESVFNLILQLDYKSSGKAKVTQVQQPF